MKIVKFAAYSLAGFPTFILNCRQKSSFLLNKHPYIIWGQITFNYTSILFPKQSRGFPKQKTIILVSFAKKVSTTFCSIPISHSRQATLLTAFAA